MDSHKFQKLLSYLVMLPAVFAVISLVIFIVFVSNAETIEQQQMSNVIAFSLAEITMILSAAGGLIYLLTSEKQKLWLLTNSLLFFLSGLSGLLAFGSF